MQCVHIRLPVDRFSGISPSARRWGNRPLTIVTLATGSRRSVETVASGHCRNVADHHMDASGRRLVHRLDLALKSVEKGKILV